MLVPPETRTHSLMARNSHRRSTNPTAETVSSSLQLLWNNFHTLWPIKAPVVRRPMILITGSWLCHTANYLVCPIGLVLYRQTYERILKLRTTHAGEAGIGVWRRISSTYAVVQWQWCVLWDLWSDIGSLLWDTRCPPTKVSWGGMCHDAGYGRYPASSVLCYG